MTNEIKSNIAVELSQDELDTVAGGLAITIGDVQGYTSSSNNDFFQKNLTVAQQTFAGPQGSGTASVANLSVIKTGAGQAITLA